MTPTHHASTSWRLRSCSAALALALLLVLAVAPTASGLPLGLVGYWPGEGNANDASGNANNGTLQNGATFGAGKIGQAFSLDGSNDFVQVPDSALWAFGSADFTIDLWVNFDTVRSGVAGSLPNVFIGQDEGGGTTNKWVLFSSDSGLGFHVNGPGSVFLSAPFSPTTGTWYNLAVTRSGGSDYAFYVNGSSVGTASDATSIPNAAAFLNLGQTEGIGYLDGLLDEVQIYNRALSSDEIASLAAVPEPSTLFLAGAGLVGLGANAWRRRRLFR